MPLDIRAGVLSPPAALLGLSATVSTRRPHTRSVRSIEVYEKSGEEQECTEEGWRIGSPSSSVYSLPDASECEHVERDQLPARLRIRDPIRRPERHWAVGGIPLDQIPMGAPQ